VLLVGCGESQPKPPDISIYEAAFNGNIETVKQHLAAGTDVNAKNRSGLTPFDFAADAGQKEVAELLIAKGADVKAKKDDGATLLDLAIGSGSTEIADLLRKHGVKHGTIHSAAGGGDIEAVKEFLAADAGVNAKTADGETPLHHAATKEIVQLLISDGADVNAKTDNGWTPLHSAAEDGHKEIAELIIANGADVNPKSKDSGTPLHHAATKEIAALLIAKGADVNAKGVFGGTPLHHAAIKEIAALLIAKGADVNAKTDGGNTPLDKAEKYAANMRSHQQWAEPYQKVADLLRKHGGKKGYELEAGEALPQRSRGRRPTQQSKTNKPKSFPSSTQDVMFATNLTLTDKDKAFLSASKEGKLNEVKSLLEEGVDIDCYDAFACTALFWAAANNHISIAEFLIEKGAYIDAGAGIGGTPIARAAYEGHKDIVELLIAKGADVNAKDGTGRSPLDSADDSVAEILRKNGAR
jgi:ankyrin repeat protein